jgi:outer membrane protein OmpA-like peptidoglycan-associated protein
MVWKLTSGEGAGGVAQIQISFAPRASVGANTLTFLQTVLETSTVSRPLQRMDVVWAKDESVPFYGARWDPERKRWGAAGVAPEEEAKGYRNEPATGTGTAYMFDAPAVFAGGEHAKRFEAVPVVAETGEMLGSLRWGVGAAGKELYGARDEDCTDAPTPEFLASVERYYAKPAEPGPDQQRAERFDAILESFGTDDATLTDAHRAQLDPIAEKVKSAPNVLVELGGFADATERDPFGVSEKRAQAVEDHLVGRGVPRERFVLALAKTRAYGASWARYRPAAGETRNRRVQVMLHYASQEELRRLEGGGGSGAPGAGARSGGGR